MELSKEDYEKFIEKPVNINKLGWTLANYFKRIFNWSDEKEHRFLVDLGIYSISYEERIKGEQHHLSTFQKEKQHNSGLKKDRHL